MPDSKPAQTWLIAASFRQLGQLGRLLFPSDRADVRWAKVTALRTFARRMDSEEWDRFIRGQESVGVVMSVAEHSQLTRAAVLGIFGAPDA